MAWEAGRGRDCGRNPRPALHTHTRRCNSSDSRVLCRLHARSRRPQREETAFRVQMLRNDSPSTLGKTVKRTWAELWTQVKMVAESSIRVLGGVEGQRFGLWSWPSC